MTNKAHNSSKYPILVLHRTAKQKAGQHLVMFHLFAFKNTIKLFFKLLQLKGQNFIHNFQPRNIALQDVINMNSWNGTVLESFLFSDVGYVVFLSEKTPALLEQCVLEGGGIEIKFKQKRIKKALRMQVCIQKLQTVQLAILSISLIFNISIIKKLFKLATV